MYVRILSCVALSMGQFPDESYRMFIRLHKKFIIISLTNMVSDAESEENFRF